MRIRVSVSGPKLANAQKAVVKKIEDLALNIYGGVIRNSPVFTGSYRASWTISYNSAVYKVVNGPVGSVLPAPPVALPGPYRLGQGIFISNGQPYAELIEYGWSKQAPAGVVRVAIMNAVAK